MTEKIREGWYPNPENEGELRYWDGSGWTSSVKPATGVRNSQKAPSKPGDEQELLAILRHGGYSEKPDFIIWGTSDVLLKITSISRRLGGEGRELYAFAAFPDFFVHAQGRLKSRNTAKLRNNDTFNLDEIPYREVKTLRRQAGVENLMVQLVADTGQSRNVLTDALFGAGYRLDMTKNQEESQRELIQALKERVRRGGLSQSEPAVETQDLTEQLKTLSELRQSGVLSEDEFSAAKKKLLGGN